MLVLGVGLGLVFLVHLGLGLRVALRLGFVPNLIRLLLGYTHQIFAGPDFVDL